jgi:hypothetical protein
MMDIAKDMYRRSTLYEEDGMRRMANVFLEEVVIPEEIIRVEIKAKKHHLYFSESHASPIKVTFNNEAIETPVLIFPL